MTDIRTINCEEALRRLFDYIDAELAGAPQREMEQHLERCRSCFSRLAVESFAGVAYPFASNVIGEGDIVLDIGSGSGTDLLLAARIVRERGHAVGLDMTAAMLEKCTKSAAATGASNVRLLEGNAERI